MATVSYGLKITEAYHVFDKTITIYRNAVHYISAIAVRHYDELKSLDNITGDDGKVIISAQQRRQQKIERLIHSTANNDAVYKHFDDEFYKFPSYLRRDAINTAVGLILSYRSQLQKSSWYIRRIRRRKNSFLCLNAAAACSGICVFPDKKFSIL